MFTGVPGLRVICPATALDANGLLRTAIRCEDPVHLPRAQAPLPPDVQQGAEPGPELHDPLRQGPGGARGHRCSRWSPTGPWCSGPCRPRRNSRRATGKRVEVIDLRSLNPVDWETIAASVRKTSRVIVAYEDSLSWGYGSEIAAKIADEMFALARCAGAARGGNRHLRGLRARARRCHPASGGIAQGCDAGNSGVLIPLQMEA